MTLCAWNIYMSLFLLNDDDDDDDYDCGDLEEDTQNQKTAGPFEVHNLLL